MRRNIDSVRSPATHQFHRNTLDDSDVGSHRVFPVFKGLIEVEILINGAHLVTEQPEKDGFEIVNQLGMPGGFPHQILLGGVIIVVVSHLVADLSCHCLLLSGRKQRLTCSTLPRRFALLVTGLLLSYHTLSALYKRIGEVMSS